MSEAFQTSYALGLLNILQNNATLKSTINITKEEAKKTIAEFNIEYIDKMTSLAYELNLNIKISEKKELSNFQKGLKQLNAPYKKTEAYEIFGNKKSNSNVSVFWDAEAGFFEKYKNVNMNNASTIYEENELKKVREHLATFNPMPIERQQELFDKIVLGKKNEDEKALKLVKNAKNDN